MEAIGERHVVEADHGHVGRTEQAALGEDVVAAKRHQIVTGDDGCDVRRGVEQLSAQARAGPA